MAIQELNEVQRRFVNEGARPHIEKLLLAKHLMDTFILDATNLSDAIANNTDILADGDGTSPRTDAPQLTGQNLAQLVTYTALAADQIDGVFKNALIKLSVRRLETILKGNL